ncbi:Os06g0643050 [Oryza sativa Japonica Group]|uniref:Os06g0643050 protein n=1 Tax=Oryza sativa subsp. japonica TaxID=39947 RepID=A0A0P0WZJ0_ORYSJ|nr:Os06g0643050 [Oryza sativa Japonica Group]
MSESSFCIHSSKAFLLSSRSTLLEFILEKACFGGAGGIPFLGNSCLSCKDNFRKSLNLRRTPWLELMPSGDCIPTCILTHNYGFQEVVSSRTSFRCLSDPRRNHHTVTPSGLRVMWPYGVPSLPSLRGRAPVHAERQPGGAVVAVLRRARRLLPRRRKRRRRRHRRPLRRWIERAEGWGEVGGRNRCGGLEASRRRFRGGRSGGRGGGVRGRRR